VCVVPVSYYVGEEVEEDVDWDDVADNFVVMRREGLEGHSCGRVEGGRKGGREGGGGDHQGVKSTIKRERLTLFPN